MSLEPTRFVNKVERLGRVISVRLPLTTPPFHNKASEKALQESLRLAARAQFVRLAPFASHPKITVHVDADSIGVTLNYTQAAVNRFVSDDVKHIIAACEIALDECMGVDPTRDKSVD